MCCVERTLLTTAKLLLNLQSALPLKVCSKKSPCDLCCKNKLKLKIRESTPNGPTIGPAKSAKNTKITKSSTKALPSHSQRRTPAQMHVSSACYELVLPHRQRSPTLVRSNRLSARKRKQTQVFQQSGFLSLRRPHHI